MDFSVHMPARIADDITRFQMIHAANMAASTIPGFKAEKPFYAEVKRAVGEGEPTSRFESRQTPKPASSHTDFTPGAIQPTGWNLDVAVSGKGWMVVEPEDGTEALTRNGQLKVRGDGLLISGEGFPVLGQGGTISVPEYSSLTIGKNGAINIVPRGAQASEVVEVDRIRIVNPPENQIKRRAGGMFLFTGDGSPVPDPDIELMPASLEASNTDGVSELISFLTLSREFELNVKMMTAFRDLSSSGDKLIQESRS